MNVASRPVVPRAGHRTPRSSCRRCWLLLLALSLWSWWQIFLKMFQLKRHDARHRRLRGRILEGRRPERALPAREAVARGRRPRAHLHRRLPRILQAPQAGQRGGGDARQRAPRDARRLPARDRRARGAPRGPRHRRLGVSPYIGLFGTVWGIMNAFRGLANVSQATLAQRRAGHRRSADRHGASACSPRFRRSSPTTATRTTSTGWPCASRRSSRSSRTSCSGRASGRHRCARAAQVDQPDQRRPVHRRDAGAAGDLHGHGAAHHARARSSCRRWAAS